MIDKTYRCDLCRDSFDIKELHGITWTGTGWAKVEAIRTEKHLCQRCLDNIGDIRDQYAAVRPIVR